MTMETTATGDRVSAMFRAVEAGDIDTLRACFAPGAVIWHNYDDVAEKATDTIKMLGRLFEMTTRIEYPGQTITAVGNVRYVQHHFVAALRDGGEIRTPVFMRIEVDGEGLVARLEEYIDGRALGVSDAVASNVLTK